MSMSLQEAISTNRPKSQGNTSILKTLQGDQSDAYKRISKTIFKDTKRGSPFEEKVAGLRGYAGTGKTYLIGAFVDRALEKGYQVFITAPTHQAKEQVRRHVNMLDPKVTCCTIHSLLGLKLKKDRQDGGYKLEHDPDSDSVPYGKNKTLIVVDEASMMGLELGGHSKRAIRKGKPSWLFVGDPAQLPPPDDEQSDLIDSKGHTMEKIVRQKEGNPIIEAANAVRNGQSWKPHVRMENGRGISTTTEPSVILESMDRQLMRGDYIDNPNVCRIVAARNDQVDLWNQLMKDKLFPHAEEWGMDMWAIAQESWTRNDSLEIKNSQIFRIEEANKEHVIIDGVGLPVWEIKGDTNRGGSVQVKTLAKEGQEDYDRNLKMRLEDAKKNGGGAWKSYYRLKEALCEIRHAFATTIHKSQGSTFETCYVDNRDLSSFPGGTDMRQRLRYVAFTRASDRVAILE